MSELSNKQRIDWIDMAKGYGILCVIIAHCSVGKLGIWMYTFHLPLFFILSGFTFSYTEDYKLFFRKKCKGIILPYFLLGIPLILCVNTFSFLNGTFTIGNFIHICLAYIIQRRMWTMWFLACLFFVNIFFYFLVRYLKSISKVGIATLIMTLIGYTYYNFGGGRLPWNIDISFMAISFFYIGYILKNNYTTLFRTLTKKLTVILCIVFLFINVIFAYVNLKLGYSNLEMYNSSYGLLPLVYCSAISGALFVITISMLFTIKPIKYLGQYSLLYFAWHQQIFMHAVEILLSMFGLSLNDNSSSIEFVLYKIVYIALIILLLTICNFIITHTPLKIMLGK